MRGIRIAGLMQPVACNAGELLSRSEPHFRRKFCVHSLSNFVVVVLYRMAGMAVFTAVFIMFGLFEKLDALTSKKPLITIPDFSSRVFLTESFSAFNESSVTRDSFSHLSCLSIGV
jgi:hypothetical protein